LLESRNLDVPEITIYTDYAKMLNRSDIDVVSIATYSGTHACIAKDALQADKHVIVEKPMALSATDAQMMIATAQRTAKKLTVCHQNRFNPPVQKLREALDQGRFGKLVHGVAVVRWNRNEEYYKQAAWRGTWEQDGGVLMNQGIHDIDLLQWIMGPVERLYAEADTFLRPIEAEDMGAAILRFKNGAIGIIEGSACIYPKNLEEYLKCPIFDFTELIPQKFFFVTPMASKAFSMLLSQQRLPHLFPYHGLLYIQWYPQDSPSSPECF